MQYNSSSFFVIAFVGLSVLVLCGCGSTDSRYTKVEGTITYKGDPVEGATVIFIATDSSGESAAGLTDEKGKYAVTSSQAVQAGAGVLPGEYIVLVSKRSAPPADPDQVAFDNGEISYDELQRRKAGKNPYASSAPAVDELPVQYSQHNQSNLKATVQKGRVSKHDFDLTD